MHPAAYAYVQRTLAALPPRRAVLEFGSRNVNGSARPLFPDATRYWGIDIRPGDGVDQVADAGTYTPRAPFDLILCTEVLEHAPQARAICANAFRILPPGGIFLLTAAGPGRPPHSAHDGGALRRDEFYATVSAYDLVEWLAPFAIVTIETDRTVQDIRAIAVKDGVLYPPGGVV